MDLPRVLIARSFGSIVITALALLGIAGGAWTRERFRRELVFVLYALALYASLTSVFLFWVRYADGYIMLIAIWGGHGLDMVCGFLEHVRGSRPAVQRSPVARSVAAALALGLIVAAGSMRESLRDNVNDSGSVTERVAGTWLGKHVAARERMFSVSDQSVYYAHGVWIMGPWAPEAAAALRFVARTDPEYIIVDREQSEVRPYLRQWLDRGIPDPRAHLIYRERDGTPMWWRAIVGRADTARIAQAKYSSASSMSS